MPARRRKADAAKSPGSVYNLSGDFHGATVNIQSTIVGVEQVRELEQAPPEPGDPPYRGLTAFDEDDAGHFFGRERLVARLAGRLSTTSFLGVVGDSGSGKSSLVRAGLVPSLRNGQPFEDGSLPPAGSARWDIRILTPTAHPLQSLAACLGRDEPSLTALTQIENDLTDNPAVLALAARRLLAHTAAPRLLLVIDQFEEVFTQCHQEDERAAFITTLTSALDPAEGQVLSVVIILRADFYARLAHYDRLRDLVAQNQEFIGAMNRDELFRAIVTPAALGNWKIQEGLVEVMLDDAGSEPGALPLLSHVLLETWRRRRGRTLTLSGYNEAGGVRGAIARTAEAVFTQRLTPEQQPVARLIFTRLAGLDEDAQDTRRRASFSELITRASDSATIELVLSILTDARLVTTGTQEPGGIKTVEVAHEALIREWPTLRTWLAEDRAGLILHQKLADDTRDWLRLDKDPGALYRGARLELALDWAGENPSLLSLDESDFLDAARASRTAEDERERAYRRSGLLRRLIAPGLAVILIGILAILFFTTGLNNRFKTPAKMNALFNIAVAEFGQIGSNGEIGPWNGSDAVSGVLMASLEKGPGGDPNILIWRDGPALEKENVTIGRVEGSATPPGASGVSSPGEGVQAAARTMADRLNAQIIIFGNLDTRQTPAQLTLEFWIAPQANYQFDDIQGSYQTDSPILVANPQSPGLEGADEIDRQANMLAWTALGLARMRFGQSSAALEAFRSAEVLAPDLDALQFFIGRASLFLSNTDKANQEKLTQDAETAFNNAIRLNPGSNSAYDGLGSVYSGEALRLLALVQQNPNDLADLGQASGLIDQALAAFQKAESLPPGPRDLAVSAVEAARLDIGIALRARAEIEYRSGDTPATLETLQQAQDILDAVVKPFETAKRERYLAMTHQALGTVWQWRGFMAETAGDLGAAQKNYSTALDQYQACLTIGQASVDRIVREDVAAQLCQPYHDQVKSILDNLKKGS
jgi:tetratricopeptide (TPR) repeat protein